MRGFSWAFASALAFSGCNSDGSAPAPSSTVAAPGAARGGFEVEDEQGNSWAAATPDGAVYRLASSGSESGKISIEADRVKVKDVAGATTAKIKAKDYGFKIYEDDEIEVMKAKRKGAGFKIQRADGTELGELATKGASGQIAGQPVEVASEDGKRVVHRAGSPVGAVTGAFSEKAASFLALTELPMAQRVAAMVYVQEHES